MYTVLHVFFVVAEPSKLPKDSSSNYILADGELLNTVGESNMLFCYIYVLLQCLPAPCFSLL